MTDDTIPFLEKSNLFFMYRQNVTVVLQNSVVQYSSSPKSTGQVVLVYSAGERFIRVVDVLILCSYIFHFKNCVQSFVLTIKEFPMNHAV